MDTTRRKRVVLAVLWGMVAILPGGLGDGRATAQTDHTVTFINRCPQQVWLAEFGPTSLVPPSWALAPACTTANAATVCTSGTCDSGACTCASNADCVFGAASGTPTATCDPVKRHCVGRAQLAVPPGWSGRFWGRTGCSGTSASFTCETGQCGPPSGGNIDCTAQNATANQATLFEIAAAGTSGIDNYDVSLVSGYNLPIEVTILLPADGAAWVASTAYAAGAQIVQKVGTSTFRFTNGGSSGTSGSIMPAFPGTWTGTVADGASITWVNTGPVCQNSGCVSDLLTTCPSDLQVTSDGAVVACDVPANACTDGQTSCTAEELAYSQCQNNGGEKDLFGDVLTFQSPNAETFICFGANDCPGGTTCRLNPSLASGSLPTGAGVCTPVAQNGGCTPGSDGQACPAASFPFVEYTCATLSNVQSDAQVCIPPTLTGVGNLWWNAVNWTVAPSQPTDACIVDTDCGTGQKCLAAAAVQKGLAQCTADNGPCTCWAPQTCSSSRGANDGCPGANQCLNEHGVPDGKIDGGTVVNCATATCYCGPQGIYSGVCGPTNPGWTAAALAFGSTSWPEVFKTACPIAYSYQFDDPSSNWSCQNTADELIDYRVEFCAGGGKGAY